MRKVRGSSQLSHSFSVISVAQWWIIIDPVIITINQEGTIHMKVWQGIFFGIALCAGACADECTDIAFEEPECVEEEGEVQCRRHYHLRVRNPEEEQLWEERTDNSWPAKRENFIDGFMH